MGTQAKNTISQILLADTEQKFFKLYDQSLEYESAL